MPSPVTPGPSSHMPRQEATTPQDDLFSGRINRPPPPNNVDEDASYGRGGRRGPPRDGPRDDERRSGGHRSGSPRIDRPSDAAPTRYRDEERPPPREDPRNRFRANENAPIYIRGSGGGSEREMRGPPPVPERESHSGPPGRRPNREEPAPDRRSSHDGGYDRRGDERRDGGANGSMRKRGRAGDEGGGERYMDGKRPRR